MGLQNSLSRLKKKLKYPLTGGRHKSDRTDADADERVDPTNSPPQPEFHVVAGGGRDREADITDADAQQVGQPPQPDELADVDGRESGQGYLHLHPGAEVAVGSGRNGGEKDGGGEKAECVHPSTFTPLIPHCQEHRSMWM